jgi:hypothetical protein
MSGLHQKATFALQQIFFFDHLLGAPSGSGNTTKSRTARHEMNLCVLTARQSHREDRPLARFACHGHVAPIMRASLRVMASPRRRRSAAPSRHQLG